MHRTRDARPWLAAMVLVVAVGGSSACGVDISPPTPVATIGESRSPVNGFTAVTEPRAGSLPDGTEWSVQLPQVRGGDRQIRAAFNGKFEAILQVLTGAPSGNGLVIGDGSIGTAERSRTIVGDRTLSGVVIVMANARQAAHPSLDVETAVFNALTGEVIDEPFADRSTAERALGELAPRYDPTGRLNSSSGASYAGLSSWVPLPEGLHVYVSVPHVMGDYLPVTIPWDRVSGLLTPDAREVLVG